MFWFSPDEGAILNQEILRSIGAMPKAFLIVILSCFLWIGCSSQQSGVTPPSESSKQEQNEDHLESKEDDDSEDGDSGEDEAGDDDFDDDFDDEFEDEFGGAEAPEVFDPLSGYNRFMTDVNDKFYIYVFDPVTKTYRFVIPSPVRSGIGCFFDNLLFPVRFVNNLLQTKFENAGEEFLRFGINTTLGVLGVWDPAKDLFGLEAHPEDFGQTLGHYGVGSGFHVVLPLLGPSNVRDIVSIIPDSVMDPLTYVEPGSAAMGATVFRKVNDYSLEPLGYQDLTKEALDLYPFLRDAYEQNRNKKIKE